MKTFFSFMIILVLNFQTQANAAPFYRFWRGWKLDQLSRTQFEAGLNNGFLSTTVQVGGGRGLIGYLPVLLPSTSATTAAQLPDEVALVIYSNEADYTFVRNTPEGKAYGDSHWLLFDRNKGSKSLQPEAYVGKIENEHAYDIFQSNADWKKGHGIFITSKISGDIRPYLQVMKTDFAKRGLVSYLVLVQGHVLYEYQLWRDQAALKASWADLRKKAKASNLIYSAFLSTQLQKQDWKKPRLLPGLGINFQF
jgi:hypothetical protein